MSTLALSNAVAIIVDVAILVLVIELVLFGVIWRRRSPGGGLVALASSAAGLCLLVALRLALSDAEPGWIVLPMTAALIVHAAELALRRKSFAQATAGQPGGSEPAGG